MLAEQVRRAIPATPRGRLAELAATVWRAFAAGALGEGEAQALAEEIAARKAIPAKPAEPRRRVGSRPRSPEAMERRRRWTSSGWLPPQIASRFTMAEAAVLSTIAAEVARRGLCRLTIGHIAALAGVCKATVRTAVREATALGIITSEEWRITAWRNAPNTVRIVSPEWRTWLRMRDRKRAGAEHPRQAEQGGQGDARREQLRRVPDRADDHRRLVGCDPAGGDPVVSDLAAAKPAVPGVRGYRGGRRHGATR